VYIIFVLSFLDFPSSEGESRGTRDSKASETSISIFYEREKQAANEGNKKCMLKISQNMSSYLCFLTGVLQKDFRSNFFPSPFKWGG
jgi:hypothetical protein